MEFRQALTYKKIIAYKKSQYYGDVCARNKTRAPNNMIWAVGLPHFSFPHQRRRA